MINPPAFPSPHNDRYKGLTLRDYFAAKAMEGFVTGDYDLYPQEVAKKAYQIADEMMKARDA
jgi:hypothetical protein